jgi:hypothetical protein
MKELINQIKSTDEDTSIALVRAYGDRRATFAIERCWTTFRSVLRATKSFREKQSAGYYLDHDDGVITMKAFVEYIDAIEKDIDKIPMDAGFKAEVIDILYLRLGNIRIDKRLLLKKGD